MKRRILLLMMTALLSVGAWAQTVTLFEGSQATTSASHLSIDREKFKGARVGSQLNIYYTITAANNVCYFGNGWKSKWSNADETSVSFLLDNDVISNPWGLDIHPQWDGSTMTVTKVTLNYNGVDYLYNAESFTINKDNGWDGALQLDLTYASEGDILQVSVSSESGSFNSGWHMLSLTNGQGDFESMGDATNVYNEVPESNEVTLAATNFLDITIGSLLTFNTTVEGLKAVSGETTLYDNLGWCENQTVLVTDDNINTIKANGIIVTVNKLKDNSDNDNTLTVKKGNPSGTIAYWRTNDFSAGGTVNIPLTSALLGHRSEGKLYLSGYGFKASSVDLIYQPSAVNIGDEGYATFGYPFAVDLNKLNASQDAYTVTVIGDKAQLTSVKGKKIPANTGIILEGSGDVTITLTTEATEDVTGNELRVSNGTVKGNGSTIYVLAKKNIESNDVVGFFKLQNDVKVPVGKAYLEVASGGVRQFIGFVDNATGIDNIEHSTPHIEQYYDLQGRRVAQPTKGLYIVNGKKVIIK